MISANAGDISPLDIFRTAMLARHLLLLGARLDCDYGHHRAPRMQLAGHLHISFATMRRLILLLLAYDATDWRGIITATEVRA